MIQLMVDILIAACILRDQILIDSPQWMRGVPGITQGESGSLTQLFSFVYLTHDTFLRESLLFNDSNTI